MSPLVRMRLTGFVRTGRALAPLIAGLVVLGVLYGGGQAQAGEAYGVSAVVLFPVLAWQSKLLLDVEPDGQRRLALLAIGTGRREQLAGLLAAAVAASGTVLVAMVLPWLLGGVTGPREPGDLPVIAGIGLGLWAHLLALPPAVALGAVASRAVTGSLALGIAVLAVGTVGVLVLGRTDSAVPWLVPPVMATARATTAGTGVAPMALLTVQAGLWTAALLGVYARRRRG